MPPPPNSATVSTSPDHLISPPTQQTWLYCGLLALHLLLLWVLPCFPSQDGPSHIYNLAILHDLQNGGTAWGYAYRADLRLLSPNHGFNLFAYPLLAMHVPPLLAERLFLSIYLLLLGAGVPYLLRACRLPAQPVALLALPVAYNHTLLMGFYSYNLAAALLLFACAASLKLATASVPRRSISLNLMGALLFICHLIPFMVYLLLLALQPLLAGETWRQRLVGLLRQGICCAPLLALYGWYSLNKPHVPSTFSFAYLGDPARWLDLLAQLGTFGTVYFSPWQGLPALLLLCTVFELFRRRRHQPATWSAPERLLLSLTGLLTVIYLLAPFYLGGGSYFNERFPWLLLLLLLPTLAYSAAGWRQAAPLLAGIALLALGVNGTVFWQQSRQVTGFVQQATATCQPHSAFLLYKSSPTAWPRVDPLLHAGSHYGLRCNAVDLGNYETDLAYFPVHFRSDYQPRPTPWQIAHRPAEIDFGRYPLVQQVFGWQLGERERQQLLPWFRENGGDGTTSIWQRR